MFRIFGVIAMLELMSNLSRRDLSLDTQAVRTMLLLLIRLVLLISRVRFLSFAGNWKGAGK